VGRRGFSRVKARPSFLKKRSKKLLSGCRMPNLLTAQRKPVQRINHPFKPARRQTCETMRQSPPPRGRHTMQRRLPHQRRPIIRGDDQAHIPRQQSLGKIRIHREIQRIRERAVVRPFRISQKIHRARFHLDTREIPVPPQRQDVGAPTVRQRHLMQWRPPKIPTQTCRVAANGGRAFRQGDFHAKAYANRHATKRTERDHP